MKGSGSGIFFFDQEVTNETQMNLTDLVGDTSYRHRHLCRLKYGTRCVGNWTQFVPKTDFQRHEMIFAPGSRCVQEIKLEQAPIYFFPGGFSKFPALS